MKSKNRVFLPTFSRAFQQARLESLPGQVWPLDVIFDIPDLAAVTNNKTIMNNVNVRARQQTLSVLAVCNFNRRC